ncbi:calmodulin, putative [Plasmodium malariae]|uniref:Calmodulin n=1 Tax=Plasmodium malariae TaxID=5858 RepID=A0A1A8VSB9_PLAMA|nr:calmodulin, putative [Plasmodium malariae]SBS83366.1 calmodulin, putative [Plasmodium malariae]SCN45137.1 calmodulin, putative [Plasmodium malariae]
MRGVIPEDKIHLIQKNFNIVDSNRDNKIDEHEFKTLLRLLGQTKTEKEIEEIIEKHFEDDNDEDKEDKREEDGKNKKDEEDNKNYKSKNYIKKNTVKGIANHERIKSLIAKLNNFSENNKKEDGITNIGNNSLLNNKLIKKKKKKPINFETFMNIFMNTYTEPISLNELVRCFEVFDNEKSGYMDEEKLRYILMNSNERLIDEDIKFFLKSLNLKDINKIDYVLLSKKLKNIS